MPRSEPALSHSARHVVRHDKDALLKRLKRVGGQVEGVARMIADDRYCVDILTQIAAIRSALDALGLKLLHEHAHGCLQDAVRSGEGDQAVDEVMQVVERFIR